MYHYFVFLAFIFGLSCSAKHNFQKEQVEHIPTPIALHGALHVQDGKLLDRHDNVFCVAGNSLFWSNDYYRGNQYYNENVVAWLRKDWKSSIIRIPLSADPDIHDSYIYNKAPNLALVEKVVEACIAQGMYVIVDWHSHRAEENLAESVAFFRYIANKYGTYPNIIYEIYNEPLKVSWPDVLKPYAIQVITAIREIDPDNVIVVGNPHWSQDVDVVALDPIVGFGNIAYTLHFYAGSHFDWLLNKAQKAIDLKLPIFVTEWGTVNADGTGSVNYEWTERWIEFLKTNQLSHCNWSVHDKIEGASILKNGANPNGGWSEDQLSESGKLVKSYMIQWDK